MIDFFNPLFFSIRLSSLSYERVSTLTLFLVLLSGFSAIVSSGLTQVYAQESSDCDRETFSLVDCSHSSSTDEETNNDGENIEQQIPSVIPFP
jgi:hypothetical protein